ncbi:hypothetical protein DFP72DRAFT_844473 [Ephemerocybe angulata]|uniref:Uncharacterized protein n=1 Tax=Ephemerocybe angulata TaxID=980116 RepID=A0A8H6I7D7_9AGAR|nr:hypothetical protein DFP72DRAFT_844473 [Tulosesus angulatus]
MPFGVASVAIGTFMFTSRHPPTHPELTIIPSTRPSRCFRAMFTAVVRTRGIAATSASEDDRVSLTCLWSSWLGFWGSWSRGTGIGSTSQVPFRPIVDTLTRRRRNHTQPEVAANARDVLVKKAISPGRGVTVVVPAHVVRTSASKPDLTIILPRPSCRLRSVHWRAYVTVLGRQDYRSSPLPGIWDDRDGGYLSALSAMADVLACVDECWDGGVAGLHIGICGPSPRSGVLASNQDAGSWRSVIRIAQAQRDWVPSIGLADGSVLTQNAVAWLSPSPIVIVLGEAGICKGYGSSCGHEFKSRRVQVLRAPSSMRPISWPFGCRASAWQG